MNAAVLMESCPDHETLSAFIDQTLDPQLRLAVVKHLAECGDCRDLVVAAHEYRAEEQRTAGTVVRGHFGSRWAIPLAAAAAVVVVVFGVISIRQRSGMPALVEAANALPERTTLARLSGDFTYKKITIFRSGGEQEPVDYRLQHAALKIEQRASDHPSAANLHDAGVASILTRERDKAVETLVRAAKVGTPSADLLIDLSAAHIVRGDYKLALDTANKALAIDKKPAAAWNIAVALESDGRNDAQAIAAWQKYLELDPNSEWSAEARRRLRDLQEP